MKNFLRSLAAFAFICFAPAAFGQGYPLPNNTVLQGHLIASCAVPPTLTGGTLTANSCDSAGEFTAAAASGTLVFGSAFISKPSCVLVDQTATPIAVFATTPTQLTLTTITSGHLYSYKCDAKIGG